VRPHFVIADGIIAMEGDGPLNGPAKHLKTLLLSDDPVAADSTLMRYIGLQPDEVKHIREASRFIGNASESMIANLT